MTPSEIVAQIAEATFLQQRIREQIADARVRAAQSGSAVDNEWLLPAQRKLAQVSTQIAKLHVQKVEITAEVKAKRKRKILPPPENNEELLRLKAANIAAENARAEAARQAKAQRMAESEELARIYERQFIKVARETLPAETYHMLIDETKRRMGETPCTETLSREAA
jgi:hypothetical protein